MLLGADRIRPPGSGVVRYVGELSRLLHPEPSKSRYLAVFKAYFDESGIHRAKAPRKDDAKVFTLGGYLAPEEDWKDFTDAWQGVLDRHHIEVFHAKECRNHEGEFRKFKDDRPAQDAFVSELVGTVRNRPAIKPFYVGIVWEDYETLLAPAMHPYREKPYYIAMKIVMTEMWWWMRRNRITEGELIACVFDRQKHFSEYALTLFDEIAEMDFASQRFDSLAFASKRRFKPLQAADALAFDSGLEFERMLTNPHGKQRRSFQALTENLERHELASGHFWDRKYIERFIDYKRKQNNPIEVRVGERIFFNFNLPPDLDMSF